ncbi:MAG: hypothetical protein CO144_01645, partial [Candidatus Nealsonbacteria bacterium CG_4_9_14_3_um_filter_35_11]
ADITLTITYKTEFTAAEKKLDSQGNIILQKPIQPGWNSVGVADADRALSQDEDTILNIDTSDSILKDAQYIIDYTANANDGSVVFSDSGEILRARENSAPGKIINPRETRGYLIFTTVTRLGGYQKIGSPD